MCCNDYACQPQILLTFERRASHIRTFQGRSQIQLWRLSSRFFVLSLLITDILRNRNEIGQLSGPDSRLHRSHVEKGSTNAEPGKSQENIAWMLLETLDRAFSHTFGKPGKLGEKLCREYLGFQHMVLRHHRSSSWHLVPRMLEG